MPYYDVALLADLRFPGGTSTAILEEVRAAAAAGYRTALLPLKGPVLRYPHPTHPEIAAAVGAGLAELVDPLEPIECGLLLVHHPQLLTHAPASLVRARAAERIVVGHHPPFDGEGHPFYDWRGIAATAADVLRGEVLWAPVGPAVREQLARLPDGPPLTPDDWVNVLDPEPWRVRREGFADGARCAVGRHSRPDPLKWPATREAVLEVYPDDPRFAIRVLGGGPFLDELLGGPPPAGWEVLPFAPGAAPAFLRRVDVYLYYHHPRWVEAFGRVILEAMAAGCAVVLPPHFAQLFADGALYAPPGEAAAVALSLRGDRARFLERSAVAEATARDRFGPGRHVARLRDRLGPPRRPLVRGAALGDGGWGRRGPRRVLLVTSNGVGLGHLTRMLALARRLPPGIEPVFATMSAALPLVRREGFAVEHLAFHEYGRLDIDRWNRFLARELLELFGLHRPAVVVFDGNMPHGGLLDALRGLPAAWAVWMRRAMWRPGSGAEALRREPAFDAVLEPGELACAVDRGPTLGRRGLTRTLGPVLLCDPGERLPRPAARAALGLPAEGTCVLLQLGSGNNFDYRAAARRVRGVLRRHPHATLAVTESPIAQTSGEASAGEVRLRVYPIAGYLAAFDLAVSAAGYNSFHELLLNGVPTLFVPNEHPMMDDQGGRARWAERRGLARAATANNPYALGRKLNELLEPERREEFRAAMSRLRPADGAQEAASAVAEMAYTLRADRLET